MRKNFKKLFSVGLFCLSLTLFAQQKPITGQVVDSDGFPVQDAYVYIEGTDNGVYTDSEGNYTLNVEPGEKVIVEYIGFDPKTILVDETNTYNVKLTRGGAVKLQAVITTGYTTSTEDAYTGSADVVDASDVEGKSASNITNALAGESAGVRVINSSGQPGTVGEINIRGIGSLNGSSSPLYVVDGVPFSGSIASINPSDIASLVILKDATATALYGSRGANGVVVINTKTGRSGKSVIEYQGKTGINDRWLPMYDVIKSPEDYLELGWKSMRGFAEANGVADPGLWASNNMFGGKNGVNDHYNMWDKSGAALIDPKTGKIMSGVKRRYNPEDWFKESFKPGMRFEHNLKFSGGWDKTNFYTSLGYLRDEGNIYNSNYERYSIRVNVGHQLNSWLEGKFNIGYAYSESNNNGQAENANSVIWFSNNIAPIFPVYLRDKDGNMVEDPIFGGYQYDYGNENKRPFGLGSNPIGVAKYDLRHQVKNDININVGLNVKFTDYLTLENRFGSQFSLASFNSIDNPFYGFGEKEKGSVYKSKNDDLSYNFLQMLKFDKKFGKHSLNALVAHEANWYKYNIMSGYRSFLANAYMPEWNNAAIFGDMDSYNVGYAIESYFGQIEYGYDRKYLFSLSARRDGSSRFLKNKWGNFGAVGAGWVISKEDFMANQKVFDYLKLKTSYGFTGEQNGLGYYPALSLLSIGTINSKHLTISPNRLGNPDITWESSKMFQFGAEMRMFNSRVLLNLDYYNKLTDDMLFDKRIAPSTGNALFQVNDGTLQNRGIEVDLGLKLVNKEDFKVNFNVNGEFISNKILKMPIEDLTGKQKVLDLDGVYGRSVGHSIYDFYTREWAGVDKTNGLGQWYVYYDDKNDNGTIEEDERIISMSEALAKNPNMNIKKELTTKYSDATLKYVGKSAIPKVRGAFTLKTEYKNWDLSAQFLYSLGGYSYDWIYASLMRNDKFGQNNWHKDMMNTWTPENNETDIPALNGGLLQDNVNSSSTRFITKSDYLALNNISLRYTFSDRVVEQIKLSGLSIFVSGDNLMLFSHRKGFNPMASQDGTSERYRYEPLSTVTLGVNVKF